MTTLYATDLDRTLIFSARAVPDGTPGVVPVERYEGRDISFVTRRQLALLDALGRRCVVVPATTRTLAQYRRVSLWATEPPAWAVVANGGTILRHGVADTDWTVTVRATLAGRCRELAAVAEWLAAAAGRWIDRVRVADDLFVYALVVGTELDAAVTAELGAELAGWGWELSLQGRKLYAVPAPLRKSAAVREIARRAGADRVIAAGDSLLDRDLLAAADVALRPAHGELHRLGTPADVITAAAGIAAGEQLLEAALARAGDEAILGPDAMVPPAAPSAGGRGRSPAPAQVSPRRAPPA